MIIVPKNRYVEAGVALLENHGRAQVLIDSLETSPPRAYQFFTNTQGAITESSLGILNSGATCSVMATSPKTTAQSHRVAALIRHAAAWGADKGASIAQTVLHPQSDTLKQPYLEAGFIPLATLSSLEAHVAGVNANSTYEQSESIQLHASSNYSDAVLGEVLLQTYVASLDCPKIHGLRAIDEIIQGHRATEAFDPNLWFVAEYKDELCGVLLLNPSPTTRCMEIAYVGITEKVRGLGIGSHLMRHAFHCAEKHSYKTLSLAVDSANVPALALYQRWNFQTTKQRFAMIKKLSTRY